MALAVVGVVLGGTAAPAGAEVRGECTARLDGTDLSTVSRSDRHDAVRIHEDDLVLFQLRSGERLRRYRLQVELGGFKHEVTDERVDGFSTSRRIDVAKLARWGVGIFRYRGVASDGCRGAAFIKITGRNPLATVAGASGAGAVVLAAAGLLGSARRAARPRRFRSRARFDLSQPLEALSEIRRPGDYVAWAEIVCHRGARDLVEGAPTNAEVRRFVTSPSTTARLNEVLGDERRTRRVEAGTLLPRLRSRRPVPVVGMVAGALAGSGILLLLQQFAVNYPTRRDLIVALASGVVGGYVIANLARRLGVRSLNRRLAAAEAALREDEDTPRYPPLEALIASWQPTHVVPEGGLPAYSSRERSGEPAAVLDAGLEVEVLDEGDGAAQILCSNGWTGWVERERLAARG